MAKVNQKHFKAGGGDAAVRKLLSQQAAAARQLTGTTRVQQRSAGPTEAQMQRLRAKVAARGKTELERQSREKNRKEAAETFYDNNKVYRNGKHVGNMVNGRFVRIPSNPSKPKQPKAEQPKAEQPKPKQPVNPVSKTEPETPAADTQLDPAPTPAREVVPAPSKRTLKIKEARTKYKDSPFKQWAHANQALAKALKPGQVGYEQVQEYFREQTKTKK